MIYQYLHGRDNSGKAYGSINELDKNIFSKSDEDSLQRTIFYKTVSDMDINFRPECYYYYSGELADEYISVTGKTTYLLPGESPLSGDRPSLFGHQYIFAEESQKELVGDEDKLFAVTPYCCRMEDVKRLEQGKLTQYYDDKNQQVFGTAEASEESLQEVLAVFGIEEEDYNTFLYTILDACGSQEKRICLVLPENSKRGTDLALKLMRCLFKDLPVWLKENCGYITYSSSLQNLFPANMQIIFIPRTMENVRSYRSQEVRYYIFDKKSQRMPHIAELNDPDIKKLVESFKSLIFDHIQTEKFRDITKIILAYGDCHRAFTPLQIKRLLQFWNARYMMLTESRILYRGNEWKTVLDDILSMVPKLCVQIRKDMEEYAKTYMQRFKKGGEEDWALKMFYAILPYIKEDIIDYFCRQIYDYDSFIFVMHFTEDMKELNGEIKKSIYNDSQYFEATKAYENKKLRQKLEGVLDVKHQFADVLLCLDNLEQLHCMFLTSKECSEMIQSNLKEIMKWDSCKISEVSQFYQDFQNALDKYELAGDDNFSGIFCNVFENYVSEIGDVHKLTDDQLRALNSWNDNIFEDPQYFKFTEIKNRVKAELKFRKQAAIFKEEDLEKMYEDLKKLSYKSPGDLEWLFRDKKVLQDINKARTRMQELQNEKIKRNKRSRIEEVFDGLFEICFRYDVMHREEICSQIMNNNLGGFLSLSKLYKNVVSNMQYEEREETCLIMKRVVESFYDSHSLNSEERSALAEEIYVAEKIGVAYLLDREEPNVFRKLLSRRHSKEM